MATTKQNWHRHRARCVRVGRLLWQDWNPIGFPVPDDEYDRYADMVYEMLMTAQAPTAIAAYLRRLATDHIGLCDNGELAEKSDRAAKSLYALRAEWEAPSPD